VTRHKSQVSARALKGNKPLGVAHRCTPDLLNLCFEDSFTLEPGVVILKARRPVFDEGARAHPVPWPGLDAIAINLDVYQRASVLLEGEQNLILPHEGSEQHATPCTPHPFTFSPSSDTCARGTAPGEGTAPVRRAAKRHLEALTPPHLCEDPPAEAGGVGVGPVHAAGKVGVKAIECAVVDAHELGGALLDVDTVADAVHDIKYYKF
jgi:hypothetical protein